jgi:uncharacterized protein (DUF697 family)
MNYDELEAKVVKAIDDKPVSFEQEVIPKFEEVLGVPNDLIGIGLGSALAGVTSGVIRSVLPIDLEGFGVQGVTPLLAGIVIKKLIKPIGFVGGITNGLIVAGISQAVAGFIPNMAQERHTEVEENTQIQNGVVY